VEYFIGKNAAQFRVLPEDSGLPWSVFVGAAGMPGQTAYYAWKEYSKAKAVSIGGLDVAISCNAHIPYREKSLSSPLVQDLSDLS
jgi:NADPH-dependent curcumin reductase CurA